jgi:hypothetical protein
MVVQSADGGFPTYLDLGGTEKGNGTEKLTGLAAYITSVLIRHRE